MAGNPFRLCCAAKKIRACHCCGENREKLQPDRWASVIQRGPGAEGLATPGTSAGLHFTFMYSCGALRRIVLRAATAWLANPHSNTLASGGP